MAKIPKINSSYETLKRLQNDKFWSYVTGDYKGFKKASKEYAKAAVNDFETAKQVQKNTPVIKAPIFSKVGLSAFKIWFLNKFRIKSPEEKELIRLAKIERAKQQLKLNG